MKRAFTLIELMVSIMIVMLISGGALVYLNKFNSRQKLEKGKDEVVAAIKMIQSSAKGRQLPTDWNSCMGINELLYVSFYTFTDLSLVPTLKAQANNCGNPWYYRKPIKELGTNISLSPGNIYFGGGNGRLIKSISTIPYSYYLDTETATVIIENEAEENEGYRITINAMGQIKDAVYYKE